ncbi:MAG: guanylate kinase [Caldisericia bacterium]|nr:guanylate kinase [Caldisericia bacterium]
MQNKEIVLISGPSGVGKKTVIESLFELTDKLKISISATTRKPRVGEVNGKDYWFMTKSGFEEKIQKNEFLEWAEVAGNYYGTPLENIDIARKEKRYLLLELDVKGGLTVMKNFNGSVISFFIVPPVFSDLKKRLMKRATESEEQIDLRLKIAKVELLFKDRYDFRIENCVPKKAAKKIFDMLGEMK